MTDFEELFGEGELVPMQSEAALGGGSMDLLIAVRKLEITDDTTNQKAAELAKTVKAIKDKVNDYWEPLVKKAFAAHKELKNKQNAMLAKVEEADKIIRQKLSAWATEQEMKRRREEEELRRIADEERRRLAEEARKAAADGNAAAAKELSELAESIPTPRAGRADTDADGMSYLTDYDIEVVNELAVPDFVNGVTIRPVDLAAVKRVVKGNPQIQIPGIRITEKLVPRVR